LTIQTLKIAVVCHHPVLSGGFIRFIRFGKEVQILGHEIVFVQVSAESGSDYFNQFPFKIITLDQAFQESWDITMVPGAGFPETTIHTFAQLKIEQFGIRVQHVLNDTSRHDRFKFVNYAFAPHIVIFNNRSWRPGSFTSFSANSFWHLEGAVTIGSLNNKCKRSRPTIDREIIVGGLINKNPAPLLEAARRYPGPIKLKLYGEPHSLKPVYQQLVDNGLVELLGPLPFDDLSSFYHEVDCVVHTEEFAGWSNLAAEALANNVPLICTEHGTAAFAINESTALVMPMPSIENIIDRLLLIHANDGHLVEQLISNGLKVIARFSWKDYADRLLQIAACSQNRYYTYAPHLGLHGKWPLDSRLKGLECLHAIAKGLSILDLGCSECIVAYSFLSRGAALVHCIDKDQDYVEHGKKIIRDYPSSRAQRADISPWNDFLAGEVGMSLLSSYNIVLFLGVYHHLPVGTRTDVLRGAAQLATRYFAIRTTVKMFEHGGVQETLLALGFELVFSHEGIHEIDMGGVCIYKKKSES
jgi:glycosyltransferase involved in cell wall biosynthesis